jgi:hypothetical protein
MTQYVRYMQLLIGTFALRIRRAVQFELLVVDNRTLTNHRRVKQLEQRVDSLIGLLSANGQTLDINERSSLVYNKPSVTIEDHDHSPPTGEASGSAPVQVRNSQVQITLLSNAQYRYTLFGNEESSHIFQQPLLIQSSSL